MSAARYEAILAALESANVRYVIAGGFAVNLHGFLRFTKDLDLLVDLDPDNALLAMNVLSACGLRPRVSVPATDFADPTKRDDWFENRDMILFQVWHPQDPTCAVDLFIRNPIDFNDLWTRSSRANLGSTPCRFASIDDLVAMKTDAGRPQDLRDIEELRRLQRLALERGAPTPPRSTDDLP